MVKIEGAILTFSSGRTRSACRGILGIAESADSISEGSDSGFWHEDYEEYVVTDPLTADDLLELSDHMIERWRRFAVYVRERKAAGKIP